MKAEEKGLDAAMQATLLRKAEKDYARSVQLIDEKIAIEERLVELVQSLKLYIIFLFALARQSSVKDGPKP